MPGIDGYDLTTRVRSDGKLKNLPVIMVTSFGSDEQEQRGADVGADAYVVKGEL